MPARAACRSVVKRPSGFANLKIQVKSLVREGSRP
jgi:hypothetical protein